MSSPNAERATFPGGSYRSWIARRGWQTLLEGDFSLGVIRDFPRHAIPSGGVYDATEMLVHRPGMIFKRGGTSYGTQTTGTGTTSLAAAYALWPGIGRQLVVVPDTFGVNRFDPATPLVVAADIGSLTAFTGIVDRPKLFVGGSFNALVFCDSTGNLIPFYYDGSDSVRRFQGGNYAASGTYVLTISGSPTGGSFKLAVHNTVSDPPADYVTAAIAYNASAADVASALDTASGSPGFTASGGALPGSTVTVTVPADYSIAYLNPSVSGVTLTGGSSPNGFLGPVDGTSTGVPLAIHAEVHLQRLLLANSRLNPNRLWFGPPLNPVSAGWDTANAWIDMDHAITGLASLSNVLLVFSDRAMWRITGDVPPPGSNMTIEPIGSVGTTDARSIVTWEGRCIFASPQGVYVTSGVGYTSLVEDRIEAYWQSLFTGYDAASWSIACGLYQNRFLFVTVLNGTTLVKTLVCDLHKRAWTFHSHPKARMYAPSYAFTDELYAATVTNTRLQTVSGFFTPSAANKNDVVGAINPAFESRSLAYSPGQKAFGDMHVSYDLRDAASDLPTLVTQVTTGTEASATTIVAESPLAATTDRKRKRITVSKDTECVSLKLNQSNASAKLEVYGIEVDVRGYPASADSP